jgi:hypothetical protein
MTTIILTIIGILLSAAAALMVIFYGGDAFNSGSTAAAANTYQNAGTNVISAIHLYKVTRGSAANANINAATDPNSLLHAACTPGGACLRDAPSLPTTISGSPSLQAVSGSLYYATNIGSNVCDRINKNMKLGGSGEPAIPTNTANTTLKMYCTKPATGNSVFVANA